jgi:hypothetical protein
MSKKEYVTVSIAQSLIASGDWKGIEEGFPNRLKQVSETILKMMDEKS